VGSPASFESCTGFETCSFWTSIACLLNSGTIRVWHLLSFTGTQVIEREQLKFPSGTATAQVIKTLHAVPMDDGDDPDPRHVVSRLGCCPRRVHSRSEAPFGFRILASRSSLDWQYSRKTSDILLSTAVDDSHGIAAQVWTFTVSCGLYFRCRLCTPYWKPFAKEALCILLDQ
jgi:uncharacterized oligopeptide transporter (OPT) family protein